MEPAHKIYVVADFEPLRLGLAAAIAAADDMDVVGEAASLDEMVARQGFRGADVLVVDVAAVNQSDRDAVYAGLSEWVPAMKVLFLGSREEAANISFDSLPQAMHLHTIGFVMKEGGASRVVEALRLVASGAFVCETDVIRRILLRLTQWASYSASDESERLCPSVRPRC